jgi:hypothetical protein
LSTVGVLVGRGEEEMREEGGPGGDERETEGGLLVRLKVELIE